MKILVLSATTGAGHMKAAEAIKKDLESRRPQDQVIIVDTIEYISSFLNWIVVKGYIASVKYVPRIFGKLYYDTDKESLLSRFVEWFTGILSNKLLRLIEENKPNYIISTHPFATEMVSKIKREKLIEIPLICAITDYAPHHLWLQSQVDAYLVACEEMVKEMINRGVPNEKIYPYGIPVDPVFLEESNKLKTIKEVGLKEELPILLLMCGSFGVSNILQIYSDLMKSKSDFQIVAVCGSNEKLYKKLLKRSESGIKTTKVLGYSMEVNELMHAADILITKPGGMTISEALSAKIPMVIFDAIPGQEEKNAEFLISKGMGISIGKGNECREIIDDLLENREKLESIKKNCNKFNKHNSCSNLLRNLKGKDY